MNDDLREPLPSSGEFKIIAPDGSGTNRYALTDEMEQVYFGFEKEDIEALTRLFIAMHRIHAEK